MRSKLTTPSAQALKNIAMKREIFSSLMRTSDHALGVAGVFQGYRRFGFVRGMCLPRRRNWNIAIKFVNVQHMLTAEHDENECRKQFTMSERVAIVEHMREKVKAQAKDRQSEAGKSRGNGQVAVGKLPKAKINVREGLAKKVGMSGKTYDKAREGCGGRQGEPGTQEACRRDGRER